MENQLRDSHFQLGQMKGTRPPIQTTRPQSTPKTTPKNKPIKINEDKAPIPSEHQVSLKTSKWARINTSQPTESNTQNGKIVR